MKLRRVHAESIELTPKMLAEIGRANRLDEEIDTSEMLEIKNFSGAERGRFYRPVNRQD